MHRLFACFMTVVFALLIACNIFGQESKPVTIDVAPRAFICSSWTRLQVRVLMRIDPNKDNRFLHFAYSSDVGESGSSLIELSGEEAPLSYSRYVWINCQYYLFTACVLRTGGKRFCARQELKPP